MRIRANIKRNSFRDFFYGLSAANKVIPIVAENNEKTNIISIELLRYIMLINYYYCDCTILSAEQSRRIYDDSRGFHRPRRCLSKIKK